MRNGRALAISDHRRWRRRHRRQRRRNGVRRSGIGPPLRLSRRQSDGIRGSRDGRGGRIHHRRCSVTALIAVSISVWRIAGNQLAQERELLASVLTFLGFGIKIGVVR